MRVKSALAAAAVACLGLYFATAAAATECTLSQSDCAARQTSAVPAPHASDNLQLNRPPASLMPSPILVQGRTITCNTSCYNRCLRRVLPGVAVPDAQCYSQCIGDKGRACGEGAARQDEPIHGNYCGLGNRGGRPIDTLDAACKVHDDCYDRRGINACACDRALSEKAASLAALDWHLSTATREKAGLIAVFFAVVPCEER